MTDVARSQAWFPAVGLIIGFVLVGVDRAAMRAVPPPSVDVLVVVALVIVTGALHLDGLADTADGLFGGSTPARRLEIMRDVHSGTYAVAAIVSVLALKWAGLAALPGDVRLEALVLAPCLARAALLAATAVFPYARPTGMGAAFREQAPTALLLGAATASAASVALLGASALYAIAFATACALSIGALATRMAGGMTGDVYGATIEVTEALLLLFIAAFANRGWIDAWALS
jgi:adenosylcobinamide-GDP ribazoletransferase